jgi:uncharacterized membrane protein
MPWSSHGMTMEGDVLYIMNKYSKIVIFLSYVFGLISLLAIIVNDKKDKIFTFHIWQAFFLNLIIGIVFVLFGLVILPNYLMSVAIDQRTGVFLWLVLTPTLAIIILLVVLGLLAALGVKLEIPLLAGLAKKISQQEKK